MYLCTASTHHLTSTLQRERVSEASTNKHESQAFLALLLPSPRGPSKNLGFGSVLQFLMWPWKTKPTTTTTPLTFATSSSPDKDQRRSYFDQEKDKDKDKDSKSRKRKSKSSKPAGEEHPLNFYLQSDQFSTMSTSTASPRDSLNGGVPVGSSGDKMETTPAPETDGRGAAGPGDNEHETEQRPTPPPHRTKSSPPPPPEIRPEEAEAFKAAGNKFYKAGQYGKAIDEYTKGWLTSSHPHFLHFG